MSTKISPRNGAARFVVTLVLGFLIAGTACVKDAVVEPEYVPPQGGDLFIRYVALGNSLTAGWQSGGINYDLQKKAYPALLAQKAGATFGIAAIANPGCPPPYVGPLTTERQPSLQECLARNVTAVPRLVQNLAVPGALMDDATNLFGPGLSFLTTLILGGKDQAQAMIAADPTFVSVWLGNNDALAAALSGELALLTPVDSFQNQLDRLVSAINQTDATDAAFIGVVNAAAASPDLQPGAYFYLVANSGQPTPVPLNVNGNCAPGTPGGANLVSFLVASSYLAGVDSVVNISCADNAPYVLNAVEQDSLLARVQAYNTAISAAAQQNGWIYVDPASMLAPVVANPADIRKCQGMDTASTPASFASVVANNCPGPSATASFTFGSFISYDGIHPSDAGQAVIADTLAARINVKHGTTLP
ncbi:MAG TPA: SGNH/GDSL hydrolase family protein [Longimicrobiales bacterium]|nr:SGNH/GDSL hydrolase family protein [Longimicrobiales bacterium]